MVERPRGTLIFLSCGCERMHHGPLPAVHSFVTCKKHTGAITRRPNAIYRIVCRDCSHARAYGDNELAARTRASAHAIKCRHVVDVSKRGKVIHTSRTTATDWFAEYAAEDEENAG